MAPFPLLEPVGGRSEKGGRVKKMRKKNAPPEAATGARATPIWRRAPAGLRMRLNDTSRNPSARPPESAAVRANWTAPCVDSRLAESDFVDSLMARSFLRAPRLQEVPE